jgi:hypothetical protein
MTPAPRKPSPSSPATEMPPPARPAPAGSPARTRPPGRLTSPAITARIRQLAAQAEHRRAIAEFHARRAADQQARTNALLLETIDALTGLFNHPANQQPPSLTIPPGISPPARQQHRHHQDLP